MLVWDIGPVSGSSHNSLSINGSKPKVMADFQTSSIGHPVISSQYVRIRGIDNQVLDISPCQIRTGYDISYNNIANQSYYLHSYFASNTSAITPDTSGADALVPVKSSVHFPYKVVV